MLPTSLPTSEIPSNRLKNAANRSEIPPTVRKFLSTVRKMLPTVWKSLPTVQKYLPTVRKFLPTVRKMLPTVRKSLPTVIPPYRSKNAQPFAKCTQSFGIHSNRSKNARNREKFLSTIRKLSIAFLEISIFETSVLCVTTLAMQFSRTVTDVGLPFLASICLVCWMVPTPIISMQRRV